MVVSRSDRLWRDGWERRVYEQVRTQGFADLVEFSRAHPASTYSELASELGNEVAPIQVEQILRQSYIARDDMDAFARTSFVRILREYVADGWRRDEKTSVQAAKAFGCWSAGLGEEYDAQADAVWDRLENLRIADGWLPVDTHDHVLVQAFCGIRFA